MRLKTKESCPTEQILILYLNKQIRDVPNGIFKKYNGSFLFIMRIKIYPIMCMLSHRGV